MGSLRSATTRALGVLAFCVGLMLLAGPETVRAQQGETFTVDATGDAPDVEPGDLTCATSQGNCTLRAAIQEANATSNELGTQGIDFDIPGSAPHVIQPQTELPAITDPVIIDGTTEPDYQDTPVVVVSGPEAGGETPGLFVTAGNSTIRGLSIIAFSGAGIRLETGGANTVQGNHVGIRPDGQTPEGNGGDGIALVGSRDNQIGGTAPDAGNVVAGNENEIVVESNANTIQGNFIGTNPSGDDLGSTFNALRVSGDSSLIGGTASGAGNVIAHTATNAVRISGSNNRVRGNYIGTNREARELGAAGTGIRLFGSRNTIGGAEPGTGNVIANNAWGVTSEDGTGNTIRRNRIYGNDQFGIDLGNRDGRTTNDDGDADDGPNRLQNFPEIQQSTFAPGEEALTVNYLVPSDPEVDAPGVSNYPLTIDFYVADADDEEGKEYLGTDTYSAVEPDDYAGCDSPPCVVTTTFVPAFDLARGDEVVATATDEEGNTSEFSRPGLVDFPETLEAGVTLAPEQYRMVSVPVQLQNAAISAVFADDFGPLDRQDWRVLRWETNPERSGCGAGRYRELTLDADAAEPELERGHAYWLIAQTGGRFDVDNARSVGGEPVTLTLPPGWTQIANPHPFPVSWSSVTGRSDLQNGSPYAYEPGAEGSSSYIPNAATLTPWTGYWVCNPGSSSIELTIPPEEATSNVRAKAAGPNSASVDLERFFGRTPTFGIQLNASLEQGGHIRRDVQNVVGVAPRATPGVGQEDVIEPPPVKESLRLSIVEDSSRLAGSLRPSGARGYAWNVEVSAPRTEETGPRTIHLRLVSRGTIPSDFKRRLVDRNTGQQLSGERGAFTVSITEERPTRHLQLLVGREDFVGEKVETVRPTRSRLQAVTPNPSRGPVSIDYQLKSAQHVRLSVFDILGRRVKVLLDGKRPAGHHTIQWKGGAGAGVASGVYFVRLRTESASHGRRVSVVR